MGKALRLLKLIKFLSEKEQSIKNLCEYTGKTEKTIRRDISDISFLTVNLFEIKRGGKIYYKCSNKAECNKLLKLINPDLLTLEPQHMMY